MTKRRHVSIPFWERQEPLVKKTTQVRKGTTPAVSGAAKERCVVFKTSKQTDKQTNWGTNRVLPRHVPAALWSKVRRVDLACLCLGNDSLCL